jgi:nitroreductase
MIGEVARVTGQRCIRCGHCVAVCPDDAVTVPGLAQPTGSLTHLTLPDSPASTLDPARLIDLVSRRRSCRSYRKKPVDRDLLSDLVKVGTLAPSGTNSQAWTFTILPTRAAVMRLGDAIGRFFRQLNLVASFAPARLASRLFMGSALETYYQEYYPRVKEALDEYATTGRDRLFHGAPAVILIGSRPEAATPKEDALLAAQNILLVAHALGLGTCLVGYTVEAIRNDPRIKRLLGLAQGEQIHAAIALGYPKIPFEHPAGRWPVTPRWFE